MDKRAPVATTPASMADAPAGIDYLVDGSSQTSGIAHYATTVTPGMEDVGEFKVITNGMSAEYGRASGGLVELVTKSGSNELHGQAFRVFPEQQPERWFLGTELPGVARRPFTGTTISGSPWAAPFSSPRSITGRTRPSSSRTMRVSGIRPAASGHSVTLPLRR